MGKAEGVPDNDVIVGDELAVVQPRFDTVAAQRLVGVVASRKKLAFLVFFFSQASHFNLRSADPAISTDPSLHTSHKGSGEHLCFRATTGPTIDVLEVQRSLIRV